MNGEPLKTVDEEPLQSGVCAPSEATGKGEGNSPSSPREQFANAVLRLQGTIDHLRRVVQPGDVVELRILGVQNGSWENEFSGYYDHEHLEVLAKTAHGYTKRARGCYVTLNPVLPDLLCRRRNRTDRAKRDDGTKNHEVSRRRFLLIDADPVRLSGISATNREKEAARETILKVREFLSERGWPAPLWADSGNGYHLLYAVDLPTDDGGLVQRVLQALAAQFDSAQATIDRSVHNAARIGRLYGTLARKGDQTDERPHRYSAVLEAPETLQPVPTELLEAVAGHRETRKPPPRRSRAKPRASMEDREVALRTLAALEPGRSDDRETWLKVGMALHSVDPSDAMRDEWISWSQESPKYKDGDGLKEWADFTSGGGVTLGTLIHLAQQDGWVRPPGASTENRPEQPFDNHKTSFGGAKSDKSHERPTEGQDGGDVEEDDEECLWTSILCDKGRTDVAFARRFLEKHGDDVCYVPEWEKWLIWDGSRWKLDPGGCAINRLALRISDELWQEVSEARTDEAVAYAREMAKPSKWKSALQVAAALRTVAAAELDADPFLLNCPNGTLDLRSGQLRPHRKHDHLTKLCPTAFQPVACSEAWNRFLQSTFGGKQHIVDFMARLIGYAITGDVTEQVLPILWGEGSNGKSTFLNALLATVGNEYAMQGRSDMLMVKRGESHPTELADLFGRRFVSCVETDDGRRLAEGLIKQLTGGERIRARRMREDFWEFSPSHKVFLCTNHQPEVRGQDHAMWRRLVLIPFRQKFWNPEKGEGGEDALRQDKTLPAKLQSEASGILAWIVGGALEWQKNGLRIPPEVCAATDQFRCEQDQYGNFISECCLTGFSNYQVRSSDLHAAFVQWSGLQHVTPRTFGQEMTKRKFERHVSNGIWYRGIALRANAAARAESILEGSGTLE